MTKSFAILLQKLTDYDEEDMIESAFKKAPWWKWMYSVFSPKYVGSIEILKNEELEKVEVGMKSFHQIGSFQNTGHSSGSLEHH